MHIRKEIKEVLGLHHPLQKWDFYRFYWRSLSQSAQASLIQIPRFQWLKQQTISSQSSRSSEVQDQGTGILGVWWEHPPWFADSCLPIIFLQDREKEHQSLNPLITSSHSGGLHLRDQTTSNGSTPKYQPTGDLGFTLWILRGAQLFRPQQSPWLFQSFIWNLDTLYEFWIIPVLELSQNRDTLTTNSFWRKPRKIHVVDYYNST